MLKRKVSDIEDEEVEFIIDHFTKYRKEDIVSIDRYDLPNDNHVNIKLKMRDDAGEIIEDAEGNFVILRSDRIFFNCITVGSNIDFDSGETIDYLKSQNIK